MDEAKDEADREDNSWQEAEPLASCHHVLRRTGGSMGGFAPAVLRLESTRRCRPGTGQDCSGTGTGFVVQTDEEPLQHHEAIQPHEARFHDQHRRQQTCR